MTFVGPRSAFKTDCNMKHVSIPRLRAFSLVEVTIAIAIAAVGLVTLLGLLPQGLEMSRKTGQISAHRHIVEQIARDLEQVDWSEMEKDANFTRYFDDQGLQTLAGKLDQSYVVDVAVGVPANADLSVKLPQGTQKEAYLRRVVIKIATSTKQQFDFSENNVRGFFTYHHYIAKAR
jgi:uncharacterized protein (TIGR02598 family)